MPTTYDMNPAATFARPSYVGEYAAKPSVGDRVDTVLDGMRNTLDNVVGTVKDKLADSSHDRAASDSGARGDNITYNQIREATPDPATMDGGYGGSMATTSMHGASTPDANARAGGAGTTAMTGASNGYASSMGTVSDDCGAISGRACGTRQATDVAGNVAQVRSDIATATFGEDEI